VKRLLVVALLSSSACFVEPANPPPATGPGPAGGFGAVDQSGQPAGSGMAAGGAIEVGCSYNGTQLPGDVGAVFQVACPPGCEASGGLWGSGLAADAVATIDLWPQIAVAPDGGVYVAWGSWSQDETALPSSYRLTRLTNAGANAPGWTSAGISLGAFHADWLGTQKEASLLALAPDGRGGVWALVGHPTAPGGGLNTLLYRLQGDGQSAADWPASGRNSPGGPTSYWLTAEPASFRAYDDHLDGVILGTPQICADCVPPLAFIRVAATGASGFINYQPAKLSLEAFVREDGGLDLANCQSSGPSGPFQPPAYISFTQSGGAGFYEPHNESVIQWFGDVGLASCGANGAVLFWSQTRERFGLFARRFGLAGQVTGVEPDAAASKGLRLAFVPGRGVVARVDFAGGAA